MSKLEWRKACILHLKPSAILLFLLALFLGSTLVLAALSTDVEAGLRSVLTMYLYMALLLPAMPLVVAELQWRKDKSLRSHIEGSATDDLLTIRYSHATVTIPWSEMYRYKALSDLVLLYRVPLNFAPVPRSFFHTDADWQAFRSHVFSTVSGPARGAIRGVLLFAALFLAAWVTILAVGYGVSRGQM